MKRLKRLSFVSVGILIVCLLAAVVLQEQTQVCRRAGSSRLDEQRRLVSSAIPAQLVESLGFNVLVGPEQAGESYRVVVNQVLTQHFGEAGFISWIVTPTTGLLYAYGYPNCGPLSNYSVQQGIASEYSKSQNLDRTKP